MWHLHFKVIFILYSREKKNWHKRSISTSLIPDVGERACLHVCEKENWNEFTETVNEKLVKFSSIYKCSSHFFPLSLLQCTSVCVHSPRRAALMTTEQHKPAVHHNAVSLSCTPLLISACHYHALILPHSLHLLSLLSYVTEPF